MKELNLVFEEYSPTVKNILEALVEKKKQFSKPFFWTTKHDKYPDLTGYNSKKLIVSKKQSLEEIKRNCHTVGPISKEIANEMIEDGKTVVCRKKGNVIYCSQPPLPEATYYTEYVFGEEYRVFVLRDNAYRIVKKVPHGENINLNRKIENGWLFIDNFFLPSSLRKLLATYAEVAVSSLKADFAAADIIFNYSENPTILEVNYNPGMSLNTARQFIYMCDKQGMLVDQ